MERWTRRFWECSENDRKMARSTFSPLSSLAPTRLPETPNPSSSPTSLAPTSSHISNNLSGRLFTLELLCCFLSIPNPESILNTCFLCNCSHIPQVLEKVAPCLPCCTIACLLLWVVLSRLLLHPSSRSSLWSLEAAPKFTNPVKCRFHLLPLQDNFTYSVARVPPPPILAILCILTLIPADPGQECLLSH